MIEALRPMLILVRSASDLPDLFRCITVGPSWDRQSMSVSFESITVFLPVFVFLQLDSKAQGELKDGMKIYNSEPGLKKSWDNVQKMSSHMLC